MLIDKRDEDRIERKGFDYAWVSMPLGSIADMFNEILKEKLKKYNPTTKFRGITAKYLYKKLKEDNNMEVRNLL